MSSLADLPVGTLGFGPIHGRAGRIVGAGELAVAPFDHWKTWSQWRRVRHVGWVVRAVTADQVTTHATDGSRDYVARTRVQPSLFAQAMPSGFEVVEMGDEHWTDEWTYLLPNYADGQGALMGVIGYRMAAKKIPYGFEDYAAIAGHRIGLHSEGLDDFIARVDRDGDPERAICSQAADRALTISGGLDNRLSLAGLVDGEVFTDGRLPQDVTPSELYLRVLEIGTAQVFRPGVA